MCTAALRKEEVEELGLGLGLILCDRYGLVRVGVEEAEGRGQRKQRAKLKGVR